MNTDWNLNNIYTSVKSKEFKEDIEKYKVLIKNLNDWCRENFKSTENAGEKLEKYIKEHITKALLHILAQLDIHKKVVGQVLNVINM